MRFLPLLLLALATPLDAQTTRYVDAAGLCDGLSPCHTAVMTAVAAAVDGDRVEVFPGRYPEAVVIEALTGVTLFARGADPKAALTCTVTPAPTEVVLTERLQIFRNERVRIEGFTLLSGAEFGPGRELAFVRNDATGVALRMCYDTLIRHNRIGLLSSEASGNCTITDNAFTGGGILFTSENNSSDSVIADNVFLAGGITSRAERQRRNRIAGNRLHAGSVLLDAYFQFDDVVIEGNVLDAGRLSIETGSGAHNRIASNRVFNSDGDGIYLDVHSPSGFNEIIGNTSRGHAGCDIRDVSVGDNLWSDNDFDTACDKADG